MASAPQNKQEDKGFVKKNKKSFNAYMKYSGMGIQMALVITLFAFAGVWVDRYLSSDPVLTIILSLSGVALALFIFIKQILAEPSSTSYDDEE